MLHWKSLSLSTRRAGLSAVQPKHVSHPKLFLAVAYQVEWAVYSRLVVGFGPCFVYLGGWELENMALLWYINCCTVCTPFARLLLDIMPFTGLHMGKQTWLLLMYFNFFVLTSSPWPISKKEIIINIKFVIMRCSQPAEVFRKHSTLLMERRCSTWYCVHHWGKTLFLGAYVLMSFDP